MKGGTIYLIFLGLCVAATGALFTALMWNSFERAIDQRHWPKVEAVILSSEVAELQHDEFSPKEYQLKILYGYEWKGRAMTSEHLTVRPNKVSKQRAAITQEMENFPQGKRTSALVNPADPFIAILKPDSKAAGYSLWFPILFVIGGLGIVVKAIATTLTQARP